MAKRVTKKKASAEDDAREFFAALNLLEQERGIKKDYMIDKIKQALLTAYKKNHEGLSDNLDIIVDEEKNTIRMILKREVVEEVDNPDTEIAYEDVCKILPSIKVGDIVRNEIKTKNFGRIAAQTARQVIIQGIREAERNKVYNEFTTKVQEIMVGTVTRYDAHNSGVFVRLNSNGEVADALLSANEQVKGEVYTEGQRVTVYISEVRKGARGTQVVISRTHYGLVRRLFEMEVPEIFNGVVEIKAISREAGSRTKMAVLTNDPAVDPIGSCVGNRGERVNRIVSELHGEKIDIIKYSEDPVEYIAAALAPSDVVSVTANPEDKTCSVVVPDDQLSLAIGKEGQNARLAARLTGYKIDIQSVSEAAKRAALAEAEQENTETVEGAVEAVETESAEKVEAAVEAVETESAETVEEAVEAVETENAETVEEAVETESAETVEEAVEAESTEEVEDSKIENTDEVSESVE